MLSIDYISVLQILSLDPSLCDTSQAAVAGPVHLDTILLKFLYRLQQEIKVTDLVSIFSYAVEPVHMITSVKGLPLQPPKSAILTNIHLCIEDHTWNITQYLGPSLVSRGLTSHFT